MYSSPTKSKIFRIANLVKAHYVGHRDLGFSSWPTVFKGF
jgi:hypothetical protein